MSELVVEDVAADREGAVLVVALLVYVALASPALTADDAIARVRGLSKNVLRVDRIEAKLTMYRDIIAMDRAMTPALLGPNAFRVRLGPPHV